MERKEEKGGTTAARTPVCDRAIHGRCGLNLLIILLAMGAINSFVLDRDMLVRWYHIYSLCTSYLSIITLVPFHNIKWSFDEY